MSGGASDLISSSSEDDDDMETVEELEDPVEKEKDPPDPKETTKSQKAPRSKAYPDGSAGPFVVFFRTKEKRLNIVSITQTLSRSFKGVTSVTQVSRDKLRVIVDNQKIANEIVSSKHFTEEYRVYIPSRVVEIDGVFTDHDMTLDSFFAFDGEDRPMGIFRNPAVKPVRVLDCKELYAASSENGGKPYVAYLGRNWPITKVTTSRNPWARKLGTWCADKEISDGAKESVFFDWLSIHDCPLTFIPLARLGM